MFYWSLNRALKFGTAFWDSHSENGTYQVCGTCESADSGRLHIFGLVSVLWLS
jgi:hypothetical protein